MLELKPELYEAQLNLGIVLLREQAAGEAASYLEEAAKQKPKEFRPVYHAARPSWRRACRARHPLFRSAIEIDPNAKAARQMVGAGAGSDREAGRGRLPVREIGKSSRIGRTVRKGEPAADAIGIYRKFPDNPAARERLGELLLESGDAAKAIPELEAVGRKIPTTANRYALAMAYAKNNEYAKG